MALSPEMVGHLEAARRFLLREPERSRRVLRLLCANYLAHVEAHERPPRKPAVWAMFSFLTTTNPIRKRRIGVPALPRQSGGTGRGPRATTAGAGRLAGHDPRRQLRLLDGYTEWPGRRIEFWDAEALRDRRAHRDLVIMLATEIYRRERGSPPPSDDALVGTYLKSLPDDGSADLTDEKTPTVE